MYPSRSGEVPEADCVHVDRVQAWRACLRPNGSPCASRSTPRHSSTVRRVAKDETLDELHHVERSTVYGGVLAEPAR